MGEHKKKTVAEQLTIDLIKKGLIIEAGWLSFKTTCMPLAAGEDQIKDMRTSFFAGAHHLFNSIMVSLDEEDSEPTEGDLEKISQVHKELENFMLELQGQIRNRRH